MARCGEERALVRDLDDAPEVHHRDAVRDVLDHREVVRDEDVREAEALLQVLQQVHHLRLHRDVERRHRFVADDELRLDGERARDRDALPLAAGELVRVALRVRRRQADDAQQLGHALALAPGVQAVQRERLGEHVADRHARVQRRVRVLEDDLHRAALRAQVAAASSSPRSRPSKRDAAAVGSISRNTRRPSVDLPQPDSPTTPSVSPAARVKSTPSTARTAPRRAAEQAARAPGSA